MPPRKSYLFVCTHRRPEGNTKGSCAQKGSEEFAPRLKGALAKLNVLAEVRACATGCLDLCDFGVAIVQEPAHICYGNVRLEDIDELAEAVARGSTVPRLMIFDASGRQTTATSDGA
jgi:(2Fe-2S) ferredoxin